MDYVGASENEPFKAQLIWALERARDMDRRDRIIGVVKKMSESEILTWCDSD